MINAETKRAVREFVLVALSRIPDLQEQSPPGPSDPRWRLGPDGHFRESARDTHQWAQCLQSRWIDSLPGFDTCVDRIGSDEIISTHLGRLVGTSTHVTRLEPDQVLRRIVHATINDEEHVAFNDERFDTVWAELETFVSADHVLFKIVAPIPYLALPEFPLRLDDEIVLDRLTSAEVTRCCQVGVLQPQIRFLSLIHAGLAVGMRRTTNVTKRILTDEISHALPIHAEQGPFGRRHCSQAGASVDDVLSALRLLKGTQVQAAGHVSWTDSPWLGNATMFRVLRQSPFWGKLELSPHEVVELIELWSLLKEGAAEFGFSIRRFSLAFERDLLDDRIVDLVIAAESLFLGDLDVQDRGELRYRFALRAAKFIRHPFYSEQCIFRVMRRAYDARSAIVHGGSPRDTRLPDNSPATMSAFTEVIEELVRLGLRRALAMRGESSQLRQGTYWDSLVFSACRPGLE